MPRGQVVVVVLMAAIFYGLGYTTAAEQCRRDCQRMDLLEADRVPLVLVGLREGEQKRTLRQALDALAEELGR